jgi:peptide/nickel transport system substrate-binding protein
MQHKRIVLSSTVVIAAVAGLLTVSHLLHPAVVETLYAASTHVAAASPYSPPAATAVFTVAIGSDVDQLDPALTIDGFSLLVSSQLYDTLVAYQPGTSVPAPGLAESWTVSPDGKTWTFNLRSGIRFHDNTALDAAAVAYNFNRWWDPAHPSHNGSFDWFRMLFGGFKGDANCKIAGVAALNATQFRLTLTDAYSPLPSILAMPALAIASPAAIQSGTLAVTPVGSGPFTFVQWTPGDHIQLRANAGYWSSPPHVSTLTFKVIASPADQLAALQSNAVHSAHSLGPDEISAAESDPRLRAFWRPSTNVGYLGINRAHTPLDNLLVRQAIAHAVNRAQIAANDYLAGTELDSQVLPSGIWGRDPGIADYAYNPVLARSLLAQAGFPHGLTTTLAYRDVMRDYLPHPAPIAEAIQTDLQAVGITTTLDVIESGVFLDMLRNGELDLYLFGWDADYVHPDDFFNPILCDGYLAFGPKDNALCNQVQASLAEFNFNSQLTQYQWASRRVYATLPLLPLAHTRTALVTRREIVGLSASPLANEAYKGAMFATAWVYLPLVRK